MPCWRTQFFQKPKLLLLKAERVPIWFMVSQLGTERAILPWDNSFPHQFYIVILNFLWLGNGSEAPKPPDVRKELACVSYSVDYVMAPCAQPLPMVRPNDEQSNSQNCNEDSSWKLVCSTKNAHYPDNNLVQNCCKVMSLHASMLLVTWCSMRETSLNIFVIHSKMTQ